MKTRRALRCLLVPFVLAAARGASGQAGTPVPPPPKPIKMKRLASPDGVYRVALPADWRIRQDGALVHASSPRGRASAKLLAEPKKADTLRGFVAMMTAGWRQQFPGWAEGGRGELHVSARPAVLIQATARPDDVPTELIHLLVLTEEHQVVMTLTCPRAEREKWQPVFEGIGDSLQLGTPRREPGLRPGTAPLPQPPPPKPKSAPPPGPKPASPKPKPPTPKARPVPAAARQVVKDPGGLFTLSVPASWRVQERAKTVTAADPERRLTFQAVAATKQADTLEYFARFMVQHWQRHVPAWVKLGQQRVRVGGRAAMLIRATGRPRGRRTLAYYYLVITATHQVMFTFTCAPAEEAKWQGAIREVIGTVRFGEARAAPRTP